MEIKYLLKYPFKGPHHRFSRIISDNAGIYAVYDSNQQLLDVGESGEVFKRLSSHDRESCWLRHTHSPKFYIYNYSGSEQARRDIEQEIRAYYKPPCGEM